MAELGLRYVRIAEFAWSRIEPDPGRYSFDWLDEAIEVLNAASLDVLLCTPTATPPKWLVDRWPEVLPVDPETGRTRGFGSRRHYDFSSEVYRREAFRITEVLAKRYGSHAGVVGWQTDNELCCHDTAFSASPRAAQAFRKWCADRYGTIGELNAAWGNVFWSMEYRDFEELDLPVGAVTETNPAHRLAYRRFTSDQAAAFHSGIVEIIRAHAPGRFVTHNFIPMEHTGVDNHALAAPLDFASYDSYPLGRTDLRFGASGDEFRKYMRTGHPDLSAYYFDQSRGLCGAPFWVMEQQPGPVNWADNNPRPAPGMVRLWTLEAFAHGADCVSYFRWRQAPFAQEQMHAGLLRPDHSESGAWPEVSAAIAEVQSLGLENEQRGQAQVAIVSLADALYVSDIERQGSAYESDAVQFQYYSALHQLGIDVDFVPPDAPLDDYALIVVPSMPIVPERFVDACLAADAAVVFGPRAGAKTEEFGYPASLPPGPLQTLIPIRVLSIETTRPEFVEPLHFDGETYGSIGWREEIDPGNAEVVANFADGGPAALRSGNTTYVATLSDTEFLCALFRRECQRLGIDTLETSPDVRVSRRGRFSFAFNYSPAAQRLDLPASASVHVGAAEIPPYGVTVWTQ